MVRVRNATLEDFAAPKPKIKPMTPRQIANAKRDQTIAKALDDLAGQPESAIKKVELDPGEKLVTVRAAIGRQIKEKRSSVKVAARNGSLFLSRGAIAGGGRSRRPTAAT